MKTDIEIQKNVTEELNWEPLLNAAQVGVAPGINTVENKLEIETEVFAF